jgi:hypothetical protein
MDLRCTVRIDGEFLRRLFDSSRMRFSQRLGRVSRLATRQGQPRTNKRQYGIQPAHQSDDAAFIEESEQGATDVTEIIGVEPDIENGN